MTEAYEQKTRRLGGLKQERQSYDSHWRDLQSFFMPRRGRWLEDSTSSRGSKVNQKLVDPTPRFAVRTAAAGIHAGSTNPATPWFKLTTPDPELNEYPGVSRWLYTVENLMRDVFERSNLYSVLPTLYGDAITFGTAPMVVLEHSTRVIHCVPNPVGSYYLATSSEGDVDTKYCEYKSTGQQLRQEFGEDKLPAVVKSAIASNSSQYFDVLHTIEPNAGREYGNYSSQSMPFASCYYLQGSDKTELRSSGFEDNPLAVLRWETTEITDPYGSCPGMDILGCSKGLQFQTKRKAQSLDKLVDPPMVGDPALQNARSSLLPGDVTWSGFTPNGSAPKFQPAYVIKPELNHQLEDIQDLRRLCETGMYVDLFMAITRADPRNASVPEIAARREEQILGLGPMLQNQRSGLIKPTIERTFFIMMRQGRLPPPPPELEGVDLKVEMIGTLAQALKAIQSGGIERFGAYVAQMAVAQANAGQEPTAMDKLDVDQAVDEYAMAIGVPPTIVRSDDDVAAIREQRAQAQQQAQEAAQAEQASKALANTAGAAQKLSQTPVNGGNALEAVTE